MKTLLFLSVHVNKWGAERSMCSLIAAIQKRFRIVVLIKQHGPIEELLQKAQVEYYIAPLLTSSITGRFNTPKMIIKRMLYPIQLIVNQRKIERILLENKIEPDLIYTNTLIPISGFLLARKYNKIHLCHIRELYDEDFHFQSWIGRKNLFRLYKSNCTKFICISEAVRKKFVPIFGDEKLIRIYNGVPFQPAPTSLPTKGLTNIIMVGRLSYEKRPMDAVKAIHIAIQNGYHHIHLNIYGSGPLERSIQEYIEKHELCRYISLCGYSNQIDYTPYNLGIICSPFEAFGRVTAEYMMHGLAVIGTSTGATPELIENGINGLLYTADNVEELYRKFVYYIENPKICQVHGMNGYKRAIAMFPEEKYINKMCTLIDDTLQAKI